MDITFPPKSNHSVSSCSAGQKNRRNGLIPWTVTWYTTQSVAPACL